MKVYVYDYPSHAGKWIYKGYQLAWKELGYEVITIPLTQTFDEVVKNYDEDYILMITDNGAHLNNYKVIEKSYKTFMFVQPNNFPMPWRTHPNFQCHCPDEVIEKINKIDNVFYWNFLGNPTNSGISFYKWEKKIHQLPTAYDSISYKHLINDDYAYDICYVGGRADNGFDEKYKIMLKYFAKFHHSKLKTGIFINKNLTHEQENLILCNSKVCLNIHDNYQRTLMTSDTNERTFKSLGCNGIMVSDREGFIPQHFPHLPVCDSPEEMVELTQSYLKMDPIELKSIKDKYKKLILKEHTYVHRVKTMLSFEPSS